MARVGAPRRSPLAGVAALAALLAGARAASAQSSPQAEQLFRDGRRLMADGKLAEACAAFDASQRLEPTNATAMNLADCNEKAGRLASAWGWYLDVAAKTRGSEASGLHDAAKRRAAAIEPRLSHLVVHLAEAAQIDGLVITLDRAVLAAGAWNRAIPIDGGGHTVEVSAPGRDLWSTRVTVAAERDTVTVDVPTLAPAATRAPAALAAVPMEGEARGPRSRAPVREEEDAVAPRVRDWRVPAAFAGLAVGAFVGSALFERSAQRAYSEATSEPDDARQRERYDAAQVRRACAIGLGVGGLVAGGVAVTLWVRGGSASTQLVPTGNGVALAGVFW